jgi:hypothetical protein
MSIYYVRFTGALPGGETWNTGVHLAGGGDVDEVIALGVDMSDELWGATVADPIRVFYPSGITLSSVVAYELSPVTGKATSRREATTTHVGASLAVPLPQEVAVCCTLRTITPGPGGRGRMYLPGPVVDEVTALGRLEGTTRDAFADAVAAALGVAVAGGHPPVLFTPSTPDREIVSVDVGDVFDAQRRRRDKLVEACTSVAL